MRIVFMGTPDFSVGTLEAVVAAGHEVACVVTQPDKPRGRGKELQPTPVKRRRSGMGCLSISLQRSGIRRQWRRSEAFSRM